METKPDSSNEIAQSPPEKRMVWVNLNIRVYHKEGERWYGKSKKGKFMSESDGIESRVQGGEDGGAKEGKEQ